MMRRSSGEEEREGVVEESNTVWVCSTCVGESLVINSIAVSQKSVGSVGFEASVDTIETRWRHREGMKELWGDGLGELGWLVFVGRFVARSSEGTRGGREESVGTCDSRLEGRVAKRSLTWDTTAN